MIETRLIDFWSNLFVICIIIIFHSISVKSGDWLFEISSKFKKKNSNSRFQFEINNKIMNNRVYDWKHLELIDKLINYLLILISRI